MSMNGHARRTIDTLVALDFRLDEDASSPGHRVYWHPNDPERRVRVFSGISEIAARKVRNLASEIAGMSSAGEAIPASVAANARMKRQSLKAEREAAARAAEKAREPFQKVADAEAERRKVAQAVAERYNAERELRSLMMPGRGR